MSASLSLHERILLILKEHREGISINAIRGELGLAADEQQHLDRRVRDLDTHHRITRTKQGIATLYVYEGEREAPLETATISGALRGKLLWAAGGRCAMCGRTVEAHGITLQIDHKVPQSWGGSSGEDNLWVLCDDCNRNKRNFFATVTDSRVQQAMTHQSVHIRLGELLKAFDGQPVPAKYLEMVAHTHDDWQKRLRELRELGWRYRFAKHTSDTGRVEVVFILDHSEPWPADPAAAIRQAERNKGAAR